MIANGQLSASLHLNLSWVTRVDEISCDFEKDYPILNEWQKLIRKRKFVIEKHFWRNHEIEFHLFHSFKMILKFSSWILYSDETFNSLNGFFFLSLTLT